MTKMTHFAFIALLVAGLSGCTFITDFSVDDAGADGGLYSIDENLADAIAVQLNANFTGELALEFDQPLPDAGDADLLELLTGGTVDLVVTNNDSGVNFSLFNDGSYSENISVAGDYNLELSPDRQTITVVFYNEIEGTTLHAGGDYTGSIEVLSNDYFIVEPFNRDVTVSEI